MVRRWVGACVVLWLAGCGNGGKQEVRQVTDAIAVDPGSYDFGDVVLGKTVSLSFTMTNNDGHARTDVRIDPPTGADAAAFHLSQQGTITLASEQSISVQVDFTPGRLGPVPTPGQDTDAVLSSVLGYDPPAIDALRRAGAVA